MWAKKVTLCETTYLIISRRWLKKFLELMYWSHYCKILFRADIGRIRDSNLSYLTLKIYIQSIDKGRNYAHQIDMLILDSSSFNVLLD